MTSQTPEKHNHPFPHKNMALFVFIIISFLVLSFGFGYFFGRHEQIEKNRTMLKNIPDVNCGRA